LAPAVRRSAASPVGLDPHRPVAALSRLELVGRAKIEEVPKRTVRINVYLEFASFIRVPSWLIRLQNVLHVKKGPLATRQSFGEIDGPLKNGELILN
jgi:hypothetical protein